VIGSIILSLSLVIISRSMSLCGFSVAVAVLPNIFTVSIAWVVQRCFFMSFCSSLMVFSSYLNRCVRRGVMWLSVFRCMMWFLPWALRVTAFMSYRSCSAFLTPVWLVCM